MNLIENICDAIAIMLAMIIPITVGTAFYCYADIDYWVLRALGASILALTAAGICFSSIEAYR